jgi:hypothetical protein
MILRFRWPSFTRDLFGWHLHLPLFVGCINVKPTAFELFSERHGGVPVWRVRGVSVVWRKYRRCP